VRRFFVYKQIPASPVLLSPDTGAVGVSINPTMSWDSSFGAIYYTLHVSGRPDFLRFVVNEDSISDTSFDVVGLFNNTTYYWRVSAANDQGTSEWSAVWSFTTLLTGVLNEATIPTEFSLSQNYPNPFNPSTMIKYALPEKAHVRLEIFNALGQVMAILVDGEMEAGYYSAVFESRGLASGLYFYRLRAGNFIETKKLIILR
jgi:hypothetical protein